MERRIPRIHPENGFFYTGVVATPEEVTWMKGAYNVPYIVVGGSVPASPEECVHACALKHGLPEIVGYYGFDFQLGEFIRLADADQGEPDKWPSRRLKEILKAKAKP